MTKTSIALTGLTILCIAAIIGLAKQQSELSTIQVELTNAREAFDSQIKKNDELKAKYEPQPKKCEGIVYGQRSYIDPLACPSIEIGGKRYLGPVF